jgi:copper chaperone CopZ
MENNKFIRKRVLLTIILLISATISNAQISKIELRATGLTCSMCSNAIFKQLESISDVDSVETDLNTNTFIVFLKKDNRLNPKTFKEKVEKSGFFIGVFIFTATPEILDSSIYILLDDKPKKQIEVKFQVLDQGYVTEKEFKKLSKTYKGLATYSANNENDYHIKILNK